GSNLQSRPRLENAELIMPATCLPRARGASAALISLATIARASALPRRKTNGMPLLGSPHVGAPQPTQISRTSHGGHGVQHFLMSDLMPQRQPGIGHGARFAKPVAAVLKQI